MATIQKRPVEVEVRRAEPGEEIETREGVLTAEEGDFIITGVNGEEYPIGGEIMVKTYIPTDPDAIPFFQEAAPEGVLIEYEDEGDFTRATAAFVDLREVSTAEERERAEAFVKEFVRTSPNLRGDEVAYRGQK